MKLRRKEYMENAAKGSQKLTEERLGRLEGGK